MKKSQMLWVAALSAAVVLIPLALKRRSAENAERAAAAARAEPPRDAAAGATKLPRFVDLGTTTCAPCKAMLVVMEDLERSYPDQLVVQFVNVQQDEDGARQYRVEVIPTQVFLAPDGRELFRHKGFYSTAAVVAKWQQLGYPLAPHPAGG